MGKSTINHHFPLVFCKFTRPGQTSTVLFRRLCIDAMLPLGRRPRALALEQAEETMVFSFSKGPLNGPKMCQIWDLIIKQWYKLVRPPFDI